MTQGLPRTKAETVERPPIEFWFEFGSTYSYPAALRIEAVARDAGVRIVWRPFLLGPIFRDQGWTDAPFNLYPAKGRYMWRDVERLCAKYAIPWRRPSEFPRNGLLAARVACLGASTAWGPDFVRAVFRANFADDRDIADPAVIASVIAGLGEPSTPLLERAGTAENKDRLRQQTDEARARGIFGAPAFVVGTELFWGNDRLEDAVAWSKRQAAT